MLKTNITILALTLAFCGYLSSSAMAALHTNVFLRCVSTGGIIDAHKKCKALCNGKHTHFKNSRVSVDPSKCPPLHQKACLCTYTD